MESINFRINYLAEKYFNGNNVKFALSVKSSEANVRNYRKLTTPKVDFIVNTCEFLSISEIWLLTGKGEMLRNAEEKSEEINPTDKQLIASLAKNVVFLEKELQQCQEEKKLIENSKPNV